jgi:hypothetical protein
MKIKTISIATFILGFVLFISPVFSQPQKITVLFVASNPVDRKTLSLDEEIRQIDKKIRMAEYRDALDLVDAWAARPDDLIQKLYEKKPRIVHFSGHGLKAGIALQGDDGKTKIVNDRALKALFTNHKDHIRVVVLNACYSQSQANAISEVVDCVIGMRYEITDGAAIIYAGSFYRAIGFGKSVREAHEAGKVALMLEDVPEEGTPVLLFRSGVNPSNVYPITTIVSSPSTGSRASDKCLRSVGKELRIKKANVNPKVVQSGQRITISMSYETLGTESVYVSYEVRYKGRKVGQLDQRSFSTFFPGSYYDNVEYTLPFNAPAGTYSVINRVSRRGDFAECESFFTVKD